MGLRLFLDLGCESEICSRDLRTGLYVDTGLPLLGTYLRVGLLGRVLGVCLS